jgi:mono/diheme cytochrome c family protein
VALLVVLVAACGVGTAGVGSPTAPAPPSPPPSPALTASPVAGSPSVVAPPTPSPTEPPAAPVDRAAIAARGATAFQAWCNSCHAGGQQGYGPALWGRAAPLTPARIRERIRHEDERERRRFAALSEERLAEIIAYIESQQRAAGGRP